MNVLAIDVGGTRVKMLVSGESEPRRFDSGPTMTPQLMVAGVIEMTRDWKYEAVSIGYPGVVRRNEILTEPHNLASGWVGFDFEAALGRPTRLLNDAATQALGSYEHGSLLFLGLGTGLGSALIVDGTVVAMELAHLNYRKGTYEDYVGLRGLERFGKKKWRAHVADVVERLKAALYPDEVVLGGGNAKKLKELPPGCRAGTNSHAFLGGFRLWQDLRPGF
jgi:polyphosphate glucokinase